MKKTTRSTSTNWNGTFVKSKICNGQGLVIEGTVKEMGVHSVFVHVTSSGAAQRAADAQEDNLPTRFVVVIVEPQKAYPRIFRQKDGQEIDYVDNVPQRNRDYVPPQELTHNQLREHLAHSFDKLLQEEASGLHPRANGLFEFWIESDQPKAKDIVPGMELRILTMGASILADDFKLLNAKANLFQGMGEGGEALSGSYASAIMQYAEPEVEIKDDREGVDEDEWSD